MPTKTRPKQHTYNLALRDYWTIEQLSALVCGHDPADTRTYWDGGAPMWKVGSAARLAIKAGDLPGRLIEETLHEDRFGQDGTFHDRASRQISYCVAYPEDFVKWFSKWSTAREGYVLPESFTQYLRKNHTHVSGNAGALATHIKGQKNEEMIVEIAKWLLENREDKCLNTGKQRTAHPVTQDSLAYAVSQFYRFVPEHDTRENLPYTEGGVLRIIRKRWSEFNLPTP